MNDGLSRKLNDYIKNIPSLPTTVSKVLEICNDPRASPTDLNHIISLDPVLVGRVLKLINSAYYGMAVTSLVKAITLLGINTVKNLALSSAIIGHLNKKEFHGLNAEGYWSHSLCVGVAAKILARKRNMDPKLLEEYFAAGLLHDIGKIPLNAVLPREYLLTIKSADIGKVSLVRAEAEHLGLTHNDAGARVFRAWRIGGALEDAVIHHHNYTAYTGEHRDLLYSVVTANYFACLMEIGFAGDCHPEKPAPLVWKTLGISRDLFDDVRPIIDEEMERAQIFLNL
jgi:HD-like signal output (HDOD) protein